MLAEDVAEDRWNLMMEGIHGYLDNLANLTVHDNESHTHNRLRLGVQVNILSLDLSPEFADL